MSKILLDRSKELEKRILVGLATFDCLTLKQCMVVVYWGASKSALTGIQRQLKKMLESGLIGRKKSRDNLYRYYLQTAGTRSAREYINFEASPGHDRSYLNCSRNDILIDRIIKDFNELNHNSDNPIILGKGALRKIKYGKYSAADGMLGKKTDAGMKTTKVYIKIDNTSPSSIRRYNKASELALKFGAILSIVASPYTLKNLNLRK